MAGKAKKTGGAADGTASVRCKRPSEGQVIRILVAARQGARTVDQLAVAMGEQAKSVRAWCEALAALLPGFVALRKGGRIELGPAAVAAVDASDWAARLCPVDGAAARRAMLDGLAELVAAPGQPAILRTVDPMAAMRDRGGLAVDLWPVVERVRELAEAAARAEAPRGVAFDRVAGGNGDPSARLTNAGETLRLWGQVRDHIRTAGAPQGDWLLAALDSVVVGQVPPAVVVERLRACDARGWDEAVVAQLACDAVALAAKSLLPAGFRRSAA